MANTYDRIRYKAADGKPKTVILKIVSDTTTRVAGYQVNYEGDEVSGPGFDKNLHILAASDILRRVRLVFDKKYAQLVPEGTETR